MKTRSKRRFLAEWENPSAIIMAFPDEQTDWNYIMKEARKQFALLVETFTKNETQVFLLCHNKKETLKYLSEADKKFLQLIEIDFNDTWTRDFGPITVVENGKKCHLDFGFNGWGLKFAADKDNLVNLNLKGKIIPTENYRNHRDFVLEGGSLETDGKGTLLTTSLCLCSENRNGGKSKEALEPILKEYLGVERILWINHGYLEGDDTDSHIDTLARLAPDDTIVYCGPGTLGDPQYKELWKMRNEIKAFKTVEGKAYNLIELPLPDPVYDEFQQRLPATYANYLVTDKNVFLPVYNQPLKDKLAEECLQKAFPDHKIIPVDCRILLYQHGSLHCSTMQIY